MKKTILFLLNREVTYLPPFMAILDSLCEEYSLKVISCEKKGGKEKLQELYVGRDVEFLSNETQDVSSSISARIKRRTRKMLGIKTPFVANAERLLERTSYDFLWVIHENTAYDFKDWLINQRFILSIYELNDHRMGFLKEMKPLVQKASKVIVPEFNRACILRVWLGLDNTPVVIPNKPFSHPRKKNIPNPYSAMLEDKKVILYQGYIQRKRNIDALCEAVKDMQDYSVVLMGKGDDTYISELKSKYPNINHISFVMPPEHLYITSYAYIGVVKYDFVSLNGIFCAPNKTWEYAGFGVPMLCHNIPGLYYTVDRYGAGICTNMDSIEEIKNAIRTIDEQYDKYKQNAFLFYESFDLKKELVETIRNS